MHWRDQQRVAFAEPVVFKQDHELLMFIEQSTYTKALGCGAVEYFRQAIELVAKGPVDFCIYIQNSSFDYFQLAHDLNRIIDTELTSHATIYLAINKFLAVPINYTRSVSEDYHTSIREFVSNEINADIVNFQFEPLDKGSHFNFVHPLVRFYLKCN